MIPLKLSVQGLYSYQATQEIDFRRLISSSVFGIFGKVGSGKTSLLEAISFALYGETERLHNRDNRPYNMMNLKSKQLKIDFEFQAGADGLRYRFLYEAKRNAKRHTEISSTERRMFVWESESWKPIGTEKDDVAALSEGILGLDYDNFKRTIIIPQNQFREFLELSLKERTDMMNRLFRLEQYDLGDRVSKLTKANDSQLAELKGLLTPLETVTTEAIEQATATIQIVLAQIAEKASQIKFLEPEETRLNLLQRQHAELAGLRQQLTQKLLEETAFGERERMVRLVEQCRLVFETDLNNLTKRAHEKEQIRAALDRAKQAEQKATNALPSLNDAYEKAKAGYENRENLMRKRHELDTVLRISTAWGSLQIQQENREKQDRSCQHQQKEQERIRQGRDKQHSQLDTLGPLTDQLERLYEVRNWFSVYKPLKKRANDIQQDLLELDKTVERLKQQKTDALTDFPTAWQQTDLKELPMLVSVHLDALKELKKERESVYRQAFVRGQLRKFSDSLTEGNPCPLCGSVHHPAKHESDNDGVDLEAAHLLQEQTETQLENATKLYVTLSTLLTQVKGEMSNKKRMIQERGEVVQALTKHEDTFQWPEFTVEGETLVETSIKEESNRQKQRVEVQKLLTDLNRQLEETAQTLTQKTAELAQTDAVIASLTGQMQAETESLTFYAEADAKRWTLAQIGDLAQSLDQQYAEAKTKFEAAEGAKQAGEKALILAQNDVLMQLGLLKQADTHIAEVQEQIAQKLHQHGLTQPQVEEMLNLSLDTEREKRAIAQFRDAVGSLKNQVSTLELDLADKPFDPAALIDITDQLAGLRQEKDLLHTEEGKRQNMLKTLQKQWGQKQQYQAQFDGLDLRRTDLKEMESLFRSSGFVNYVSSVYLRNLCESANDRFFRLTNHQLKLELDDKNSFLVRDYLNGGEVRSVKTLSGGQMFQASLSLALALSDNIQHLTKAKQNLFFLDEGFGTLDKDSLQTVFQTLKALRAENRVVGIISHVEELQQEVDTYIRAEATSKGSRIVRSWE